MSKMSRSACLLCAFMFVPSGASATSDMAPRPTQSPAATRNVGVDACGSNLIAKFSGLSSGATVNAAVAAAAGHNRIRWIKPGTVVARDYRPDRLNVILDDVGRILTMRCG